MSKHLERQKSTRSIINTDDFDACYYGDMSVMYVVYGRI